MTFISANIDIDTCNELISLMTFENEFEEFSPNLSAICIHSQKNPNYKNIKLLIEGESYSNIYYEDIDRSSVENFDGSSVENIDSFSRFSSVENAVDTSIESIDDSMREIIDSYITDTYNEYCHEQQPNIEMDTGNKLSDGALAAIVISCVVVVELIVFIIVYCFLSRKGNETDV